MAISLKNLTYEDFLHLPEIKQRYEVIDGALGYMSPAPTPQHQMVARNLFRLVDRWITERGLGELLFAPVDVLIQRAPLRTRQPDLLFVSQQRHAIIGSQHIEGGPDLIIEILSPANTRADVEEKLSDYWAIQVQECWLVSPEARTVEVLQSAEKGFERIGLYGMGDTITSDILPELRVQVAEIW
jgi:Uma2 family endonuclease